MNKHSISKFGMALTIVALALGAFASPVRADDDDGPTIVDVAIAANEATGEFSILIAALQAADPSVLRKLSNDDRRLTVFAPTDAAFGALLAELGLTAEELLGNQDLVTQVLLYHVARGERNSGSVLASKRIRTLEGGFLYQNGGVLTDENGRTATIVAVDIQASNGVIHVIDQVVLPGVGETDDNNGDDDDNDDRDDDDDEDEDDD